MLKLKKRWKRKFLFLLKLVLRKIIQSFCFLKDHYCNRKMRQHFHLAFIICIPPAKLPQLKYTIRKYTIRNIHQMSVLLERILDAWYITCWAFHLREWLHPLFAKKREFYVKKINPSNLYIVATSVDIIFRNKTKTHNAPSFCKMQWMRLKALLPACPHYESRLTSLIIRFLQYITGKYFI